MTKYEILESNYRIALEVICTLCKRLNPQHSGLIDGTTDAGCTSCTEMDAFNKIWKNKDAG